MIVLVPVVLIAAVLMLAGSSSPPRKARAHPAPPPPEDYENPAELAARDPIEALLRYGTPETAEQLRAQGVDLAALGYRGDS